MKRSVFWENHVRSWEKSGLSQSDYCRREKVSLTSFCSWRKRLEGKPSGENFVELTTCSQAEKIELVLQSGLVLKLPISISIAKLQELTRCLG